GRVERARAAFRAEARSLREQQRADDAAALLEEALALEPSVELAFELADVLRSQARYAEALAVLADERDESACLLRAELLRLSGERAAAQAELAGASFAAPGLAARAQAIAARIAFDGGELA